MAKIVSFNTDAPGLKPIGTPATTETKKRQPKRDQFELEIAGDYLSFAGQRELRAYLLTASKGLKRYTCELPDKTALLGCFLDVMKIEPNDASDFIERAERGKTISLECPLDESGLLAAGFVPSEEAKAVA